jgi:hypothetical protein
MAADPERTAAKPFATAIPAFAPIATSTVPMLSDPELWDLVLSASVLPGER